jgi:hypothetical protein
MHLPSNFIIAGLMAMAQTLSTQAALVAQKHQVIVQIPQHIICLGAVMSSTDVKENKQSMSAKLQLLYDMMQVILHPQPDALPLPTLGALDTSSLKIPMKPPQNPMNPLLSLFPMATKCTQATKHTFSYHTLPLPPQKLTSFPP